MLKITGNPWNLTSEEITTGRYKNPFLNYTADKKPLYDILELSKSSIKNNPADILSFRGKADLSNQKPAIQMKLKGVSLHQKKPAGSKSPIPTWDLNINLLGDSNWRDGQKLNFQVAWTKRGEPRVKLFVPELKHQKNRGEIGRVHDEIAEHILPFLQAHPENFQFELSNIIAGNSKGAPTAGIRVNLLYKGDNKNEEAEVKKAFSNVMRDPGCKDKVLIYQPPTSPKEMEKIIINNEKKVNGAKSAQKEQEALNNIAAEIKNPENKRILVIGHSSPDGDTLAGSGLAEAIRVAYPSKTVDFAVDDKLPGMFRHKVPGIEKVKRPFSALKKLNKGLETLKQKLKGDPYDKRTKSQIKILESDKKELEDKKSEKLLNPDKKYDLVILEDVPNPDRLSQEFKEYIKNAKKVASIDHHPARFSEWDKNKEETGFDMKKARDENLVCIDDKVPAAAQMLGVLVDKILPDTSKLTPKQKVDIFGPIVVGSSTDTGSFTRNDNSKDGNLNYMPEGQAKYLMNQTDNTVSKKWLRDTINYDIPDAARERMVESVNKGKEIHENIGLGMIKVDYDDMFQILQKSHFEEQKKGFKPETTLLDVENSIKYSEIMGDLRSNPALFGIKNNNPNLKFENDKIAIMVCQDKKSGNIDQKGNLAQSNGIRLSLRSQPGTVWAELLANLFGGGGHGPAAGARIDLPNVDLNTKLAIKINGKIEYDHNKILKALKENLESLHDPESSDKNQPYKFETVKAPEGKGETCSELLTSIVKTIRLTPAKEFQNVKEKINEKENNIFDIGINKKKQAAS